MVLYPRKNINSDIEYIYISSYRAHFFLARQTFFRSPTLCLLSFLLLSHAIPQDWLSSYISRHRCDDKCFEIFMLLFAVTCMLLFPSCRGRFLRRRILLSPAVLWYSFVGGCFCSNLLWQRWGCENFLHWRKQTKSSGSMLRVAWLGRRSIKITFQIWLVDSSRCW